MYKFENNGQTLECITKDEAEECGLLKHELFAVNRKWYLVVSMLGGRRELYTFAGYQMDKLDFAYPQQLWDDPRFEWRFKNDERCVFYYGRNEIYGELVWDDEMHRRIVDILAHKFRVMDKPESLD